MNALNYDMFGTAKQIQWQSKGRVFSKRSENINWSIQTDELFLGHDWYLEKYEIINEIKNGDIIIDVGYKTGDWIGRINHFIPPDIVRIGIDPMDYGIRSNITHYYNCAIDNVDQSTEMSFYLFDEPGCNSLLQKSDHLIMRNVLNTIKVPVRSLSDILSEKIELDTPIHYVKCDCQGKDTDVIKSLKSHLAYTKYVQIETSFDRSRPFYINQPNYESDILSMNNLGFTPIYWMEYLESPLPEGEIIFKNNKL